MAKDSELRFRVTAKDDTGATLVSLRGKLSDLDKTAKSASGGSDALGGSLGNLGKMAGAAATGFIAANVGMGALTGGVKAAIGGFADFEAGMNRVATVLPGISEQALGQIGEQVKAFSAEFAVLPNEVIPALYDALSSGIPADNVFTFLETAQMAAVGGVSNLNTVVKGLSAVVNSYGSDVLAAGEASDLMFTAVAGGVTTFEEMAGSLAGVTPIAASVGVEFKEVTAAIAAMTLGGTSTSEAVTQLRSALVALSDAGSEVGILFEDIAGVSFRDFIAQGGTVQSALQLLEQHAKDTGVGINDLFGEVRAGLGALQLTGAGTEVFSQQLAAAEESAGSTQVAYEQMAQGLQHSFDQLQASLSLAAIEIGAALAPGIEAAADAITIFAQAVGALAGNESAMTSLAIAVGGVATVFLTLKAIDLVQWAASGVRALTTLGTAAESAGAKAALARGKWALLATAVIAVGVAAKQTKDEGGSGWDFFGNLDDATFNLFSSFQDLTGAIGETIVEGTELGNHLRELGVPIRDTTKDTDAWIAAATSAALAADGFTDPIEHIQAILRSFGAEDAPKTFQDMAESILATGAAAEEASSAIEDSFGVFDPGAEAASAFADALFEAADAGKTLADIRFSDFWVDGLYAAEEAAKRALKAQLELQQQTAEMAGDDALAESLQAQIDEIDNWLTGVDNAKEALNLWSADIKANRETFLGGADDVTRMQEAIGSLVPAAGGAQGAIELANDAMLFMGGRADETVSNLADVAAQAGATEVKIDDFGNAVLTLPDGKKVTISLEDLATQPLGVIQGMLAGLPRSVSIAVNVVQTMFQQTVGGGAPRSAAIPGPQSKAGMAIDLTGQATARVAGVQSFVLSATEIGQALQQLPELGDEIADALQNFIDLVEAGTSLAPDLLDALAILPQIAQPANAHVQAFYGAILNVGSILQNLPQLGDEMSGNISNFLSVVGDGLSLAPDLLEALEVLPQIAVPANEHVLAFYGSLLNIGSVLERLPQLAAETADGLSAYISVVGDALGTIPDLADGLALLPEIAVPANEDVLQFYGALLNIGYVLERLPQLADQTSSDISNFLSVFGDGISLLPDMAEGLALLPEIAVPGHLAIVRFSETIRLIGNQLATLPGLGDEISNDIQNFIATTGDGISLIPDLVDGLAEIDQIIPPGHLAAVRFAEAIRLIGLQIATLPGLGDEIANDIQNFLGTTGEALALTDSLLNLLDNLDKVSVPGQAAVLRFRDSVVMIGNAFAGLPGLGEEIATDIQAFLAVSGDAISLISEAVEGFAALPDIVAPDQAALATFSEGIVSMVDALLLALEEADFKIRVTLMERVEGFAGAASSVLQAMGAALDIFGRWNELTAINRKNEARFEAVVDEFTDRFAYVVQQAILKINTRLTQDQADLGAAIGSAASTVFGAISAGIDVMNGVLEGTLPEFRDTVTAVMDGLVAAIEVINTYEGVLDSNAEMAANLVEQVVAILKPIQDIVSGGGGGAVAGGGGAEGGTKGGQDIIAGLFSNEGKGGQPYLKLILEELRGGLHVSGGAVGAVTGAGALVSGASGGSAFPVGGGAAGSLSGSDWLGTLDALLANVPPEAAGKVAMLLEVLAAAPELDRLRNALGPDGSSPLAGLPFGGGFGLFGPQGVGPWNAFLQEQVAVSAGPAAPLSLAEQRALLIESNREDLVMQQDWRGLSDAIITGFNAAPIVINVVLPNGDVLGKAVTQGQTNEARRRGYIN